MSRATLRKFWSHLPGWGALLLGFGALAGDARADRPQLGPPGSAPRPSSQSASQPGEVRVMIHGEKLYISQDGRPFEQLELSDTPEAAYLKMLLRDEGADRRSVSIPVDAMIVASGGGGAKGEKPRDSRAANKGTGK
jgi:hypothetical protein